MQDEQSPDVDSALALVCALPATGRAERRIDVAGVITRAHSVRTTDTGIVAVFENADDVAADVLALTLAERRCCAQFRYSVVMPPRHAPLEFHVDAEGSLIEPLQALY